MANKGIRTYETAVASNVALGQVGDFTIPKGVTIFGYFASIELDSGKVIAYKAA
jgi:hypothetical protein